MFLRLLIAWLSVVGTDLPLFLAKASSTKSGEQTFRCKKLGTWCCANKRWTPSG